MTKTKRSEQHMSDRFKDKLVVQKGPAREAYEYAIALKNNIDFEKNTAKVFLAFTNYIKENYPDVKIDTPKLREKSPKSIRGKIRRLELERLAKLYAIEGISKRQQQSFLSITQKLLREDKVENPKKMGQMVKNLLYEPIENIDISNLTQTLITPEINEHSQTAFLRILKTRIEQSNRKDKEEVLRQLEKEYGEEAAIREKNPEANKLRSENLEEIKNNPAEIERLHKPKEYLKAKDLLAMRFVFTEVPEEGKTQKKQTKVSEKDENIIRFTRQFSKDLLEDTAFLDSLGIALLPNAYKHKTKQNGYVAEHFKFYFKEHPEQIFELQLRSIYREEIAQVGQAAHCKRAGKKRVLPEFHNLEQFYAAIRDMVPKYTIVSQGKVNKCTWAQNAAAYFQDSIDFDSPECSKIMQVIQEEKKYAKKKMEK